MATVNLPLNPGLQQTSRLRSLTSAQQTTQFWEWCCLAGCGVTAAVLSTFLDFSLRIPGHAILRAVFPMAIGLALIPRHGAGTVMGGSALLACLAFRMGGIADGPGFGALTSLTAIGPILDCTLRHAGKRRRTYLQFALAGLAANALAFLVRGGMKWGAFVGGGKQPFWLWWPKASLTYIACGLLAGLAGGAILFYGKRREETARQESAS
ncbi:MAG: hypothetical protein IID45_08715 [Planctomycetes bacterium]|nr:hypothetical protein [Planctomycetota bacterium]